MLEDNQGEMDESTFQIDEKEVKVEVMRSRGAGGQVIMMMTLVMICTQSYPARQQNRIGGATDAHPNWYHSIDAGLSITAPEQGISLEDPSCQAL